MDIDEIAEPEVIQDAVRWSYVLLLGREETDANLLRQHVASHKTIGSVRRAFMQSDEFLRARTKETLEDVKRLFDAFPAYTGPGEEGFFHDFLGTRTRCAYLPEALGSYSGRVQGRPGTNAEELHELPEWVGTLRAVSEAKARGRLVVAELGAGWGPWLVIAAAAAVKLSIPDVTLVGVEGSKEHVAFMRQHFADNGLNAADHAVLHSVVGVEDGFALFPVLHDPRQDWGARARFGGEHGGDGDVEKVPCVSLATIARGRPPFDLIHCDIQGAEGDVLPASADVLNARVRRLVVGTHSLPIERTLIDFFNSQGWQLEHEQSCQYAFDAGGGDNLLVDGCQVWRNPATLEG